MRAGGLQSLLVEMRLQIVQDVIDVLGIEVQLEWVCRAQNCADELTRVPSAWLNVSKSINVSSGVVAASKIKLLGRFSLQYPEEQQASDQVVQ